MKDTIIIGTAIALVCVIAAYGEGYRQGFKKAVTKCPDKPVSVVIDKAQGTQICMYTRTSTYGQTLLREIRKIPRIAYQ